MTNRKVVGRLLRRAADRVDPAHAPRGTGFSFTIEPGRGFVIHQSSTTGCPLWYLSDSDYLRAFEGGSDGPAR